MGRKERGGRARRSRVRPGTLARKLEEFAEKRPWIWLTATVVMAWVAIFAIWTSVFYYALTVSYQSFTGGVPAERTEFVVLTGLVLSSVVAPLFGVTWAMRLKRELEAARELSEYAAKVEEEERRERERAGAREGPRTRAGPTEAGDDSSGTA
jgi:TRAP-type C4-dicarboxylate transport system permease small subunit